MTEFEQCLCMFNDTWGRDSCEKQYFYEFVMKIFSSLNTACTHSFLVLSTSDELTVANQQRCELFMG